MLLIDAFGVDDPDRVVASTAAETLIDAGHEVDHLRLDAAGFVPFMSSAERAAYHGDQPLIAEETKAGAQALERADGLLFCYPTTTFTVPALLKGWLERVLVVGVAFEFDDKGRTRPGMTNIRRIGVVTTTPHRRWATRRARDLGRRTILWTLRLSCHRLCRRTFVSIPAGTGPDAAARIRQALRRW